MSNIPPETWLFWVNIARIWGLAIAAIAGVISLVAGITQHNLQAVVSAKKDEALRIFQAESQERIALANASAAEANARAAEAIEKAEQERLARVKIEERIAWRRLSKDQQAKIGSQLRRFSGETTSVWFNQGDIEGSTFASDIASALKEAQWNLIGPPSSLATLGAGLVETGIIITSTEDEDSLNASEILVRELIALGFDATKSPRIESRPVAMVIVTIEVRPEGPQGEAKLRAQK